MTFVKPNKTKKANQTDLVMTNPSLAKVILDYFNPTGIVFEPARGDGAFYNQMKDPKGWCEITDGRDFFDYDRKVDWIVTNPPYSIYDQFLLKCFEVADNVVLLVPLAKAFKSKKIDMAIQEYGGLKEVLMLGGGGEVGFKFGFPVGCLYYQRGYKGKVKITRKYQ
jgi:hypothetical protein